MRTPLNSMNKGKSFLSNTANSTTIKICAAVFTGLILLFLFSGHLISFAWQSHGFRFESGEYITDRIDNMAFAMAAKSIGPNFLDPVNRTDPLFYQYFGYWVLGGLSRIAHLEPWTLANILHVFFPILFLVSALFTFNQIAGRFWVSICSILVLFCFGNLEIVVGQPRWFGLHAIMLTFNKQTYGFYLDSYSLTLGIAAIGFFVRARKKDRAYPNLLIAASLSSLALLTHYLSGLYVFFTILSITVAWSTNWSRLRVSLINNKAHMLIVILFFLSYIFALFYWEWRPPMSVIAAYVGSAIIYFVHYRLDSRYYLYLLASILAPCMLAGLNLYIINTAGSDGLFYNSNIRNINLSIPFKEFAFAYAPVIMGCFIAIYLETRKEVRLIFISMIMVSFAFIFNSELGYNNHPYRFIPYSMPFLVFISLCGYFELTKQIIHGNKLWVRLIGLLPLVSGSLLYVLGVRSNLEEHARFAPSQNKQIDHKVDAISSFLNKISGDRESAFLIDPRMASMRSLAPYTIVNLVSTSMTNPRGNSHERQYLESADSLTSLISRLRSTNTRIDYVLTTEDLSVIAVKVSEGPAINSEQAYLYRFAPGTRQDKMRR